MLICFDQRTEIGCGTQNKNQANFCHNCGRPLRFALQFHDPGTVIGRYRIVGILGRGDFGAVYEAEDMQGAGLPVALKETYNPKHIRSFEHEFAVLQQLRHPNLPNYMKIFEENSHGYLVMELIPGQSLADVLNKQCQPLQEAQVLGYALQLCAALSHLHFQSPAILHSDIKPANIRVTPTGLIKLVDFGLIKVGNARAGSEHRALSIFYAPLEQYSGDTDARSDIYSLGATLYHLLTAHPPIPSPERLAISPDPLPAPQTLNPNLSSDIATALHRAMELRQAERYPDVMSFKQALVDISVPVPPPPPASPKPKIALIVCQKGEGDHQSINEAIENASPNMDILIQPGIYNESLILDKPLQLIGDGAASDIIIESTDGNCIIMQTEQASVRGLTLRCCAGQKGGKFFAVDIPQGQLLLEDCDITSDSLSCVAIHGADANPTIRRCQIHDGKSAGLFVYENGTGTIQDCDIFGNALAGVTIKTGGNSTIRQCKIYDGKSVGILVLENGTGTIQDCDIFGNALSGVEIRTGGNPLIRGCQIHDGKGSGLFVYENGTGTIQDCDIFGNAFSGVQIRTGGDPTIRGCQIHDGKQNGLFVYEDGTGTIQNCDIFGNALAGVQIQTGANPTIRQCKIHDGKQNGVYVHQNGIGRIKDCDIFGNAYAGVQIKAGDYPIIRSCRINRNRFQAVWLSEKGAASVEECDLTGNSRGAWLIEEGSEVQRSGNKE